MARKPDTKEIVQKVMKDFEDDKRPHDAFVRKVDLWYRAYLGEIEERSKAAAWTSKLHPAYIYEIVETLVANVVDPNPRWSVKARPRMGTSAEIEQLQNGARANELILAEQVSCDRFAAKQMPFAKQALIAGHSVFKTFWDYSERDIPQQDWQMDEISPGVTLPRLTQTTRPGGHDDPSVDVVDVRDWIPHQGAVSLDKALRVTHRCYYTFDQLKALESQGVYGTQAGGESLDRLKDSKDFGKEASQREQHLYQADRTKDQIEVLEQWRRNADGSMRVVSVGNRDVLLRDTPTPFWHNEFPFVVCAPIPDLNRIGGISVVGQVVELQEAGWSLLNQRFDNTELLNNAIILIRSDVDDIDSFEWAPGAQWVVDDPAQVKVLEVPPMASDISLQAEDRIKQDLQNVAGASPSLLGQTDSSSQTATEVSLSTSLAQRKIALMKQQFKWAYRQVGEQWLSLNQQFISEQRVVEMTGPDGGTAWNAIHPLLLQGDFYIDLEAMDESLMRQERRAEATSKLQTILNGLPATVGMAQAGLCRMPNLDAYYEDYLDAFDVLDKERYFKETPPKAPQLPQGPPGANGSQPAPGAPPGGITAPQAYDMTSPSNANSLSPIAALQRMGAMTGGPNNT